ncbi:ARM repeat-containing protein [Athelia psychrophila]|uniref:ARM repeat-containing protein n=1 Tax=Athelia psychrophila TaxID=1759441 RepID=A0A167TCU1_9AGAM|nr:ARM repeat-containing protein [Fibularhizoctonia sp. CBS 109695]
MTATESKRIRISAATAFSYLIPSDSKDPDSKTALDKSTGTYCLLPPSATAHSYIGKLRDSGCLDLVIALICRGEEDDDPKDVTSSPNLIPGGTVTTVTDDIEEAIKLEKKAEKVQQRAAQKAEKVQQRAALKEKNIADKQEKKRDKDLQRSRKPSAQVMTAVTPGQHTPPETVNTSALQKSGIDIMDKAVAGKEADYLQKAADKLRPHAFLAMCTFVDHVDLRKTIVERNVLEALVDSVKDPSEYMSSVAAQALLHMLVYVDVAAYIVLQKDLTEKIIAIALNEATKVPVSAARILEQLAKHDCTRTVMATSRVPEKVFELLKAGEINFIKSSRLSALCKFSAYDDLRPALLEIQLVAFLVKKAGRKDKHKRKACLTALITLAGYDKMHEEILKAGFVNNLINQLGDEDTDIDAQNSLVSLCAHEDFRSQIIPTDFLKILVHRLEKKRHFDDAQYSLNALIQYEDVRRALVGPTPLPFISALKNVITKGGAILHDLGDAMYSFCLQHDIHEAIMQSQFVEILLDNARKGTMWGLEVLSRLLQSDLLKIPEFRKKLMDGGLVTILNDIGRRGFLFALTFIPAILSYTGEYDDMREDMLASGDIVPFLTTRMQYVSISSGVFKDHHFHPEIDAKFEECHFDIDELDHVSLSLSRIFRLGHENVHMIRSFLAMMATQPRGFRRMLKYGASDDW